jgi:calcineurin-like phosphoesterase family protein
VKDRVGARQHVVEGNHDVDLREWARGNHDSAVEVLNRLAADGQIKRELLLDRDLSANPVSP